MRHLGLVLMLLLAAACSGNGRTGPPTGRSEHSIRVGDRDRTYLTYRPESLPSGETVPLVVVLHGAAGSGRQAENSYGWDARADRDRFLVAYPDGVNRTWNASPDCCGVAARDQVDDVGFIRALVAELDADAPVDADRIFLTGISNGALLTYRLACETTLFAAIGIVAGTMINPCPHPAPTSVLHIHGTADQTIPYGGGPGRRNNGGAGRLPVKIDGPAVPDLIATWRRVASCPAPAQTVAGVVTTSVADCPGGRAVELVTIAGAGHQWPGAPGPGPVAANLLHLDPPSNAVDATGTIWQFFAARHQ